MSAVPARPGSPRRSRLSIGREALVWGLVALLASPAHATTPLADAPPLASVTVPGNVALSLSVEFPTAISVAHQGDYSATNEYLGYFDPRKCYSYVVGTEVGDNISYFQPAGLAAGTGGINRTCSDTREWSGNFLNWATMQTIDPFRWALTGGYRRIDTTSMTVLERAWASRQGSLSNFPDRSITGSTVISGATPFTWSNLNIRAWGRDNRLRFSGSGDVASSPDTNADDYEPSRTTRENRVYEFYVRVRVCDHNVSTAGPLEANCVRYSDTNHKPEGLIQRYSDRMRFAAFGYLNDDNIQRDGGVLRAPMKFVGPQQPVPGAPSQANTAAEWSATTGIMTINPDATDAANTATLFGVPIPNSGVMNYLNKFGQAARGYKTYDPVNELYYAAIRYFKNQGNVESWYSPAATTNLATRATWADGFPVVANWADPILYSCQKNFIIGIGDVNTWNDKNLPGPTESGGEPMKPDPIRTDTTVDAVAATNRVGELQGLGSTLATTATGAGNSRPLMAGLAWDAHTRDIRPDLENPSGSIGQTIDTFWLDVLEFQTYRTNNKFYLASKFGGFNAPPGFNPATHSGDLPQSWWSTTGQTIGGQPKPDNYFTAGNPSDMVAGLSAAFAQIAAQIRPFTTSFATAVPQVASAGSASFSARYDSATWTGEVQASTLTFAADGTPSLTPAWTLSSVMGTQFAGTGWDTNRRVVTRVGGSAVGFRSSTASLTALAALNPSYTSESDAADYISYLRGERRFEQGAAGTEASRRYRARASLLGDITGSKLTVVGPPSLGLSDATNPGYSSFRTLRASRPTMVYFGANDGMLHAVRGDLTGAAAGQELFAYVPGDVLAGPTATPQTNGLAALGNPNFVHYNFVNATPVAFDVDFARTRANTGTADFGTTPDWRTVLVGGLGKGGRSYYALDVTDPAGIRTAAPATNGEADVITRSLWEFRDTDLGYTYGEPVMVKTRQYGWVLVFGSGYNNTDGRGYFFIVNPRNGALLQKITTGVGTATAQAGLAHVAPFFIDRTDGVADAIYGGDLLGNVWRLDISAATGTYPAPVAIARLTDGASPANAQPITTPPSVEVNPADGRRYVFVGTGRLLDGTDLTSSRGQSFYALRDGTGSAFAPLGPNPRPLTTDTGFPITRSNLTFNANTATAVTVPSTSSGWYVDLGTGGGGAGYRVVNEASTFEGIVSFAATLPEGSACQPSGSSRIYILSMTNAQSVIPGTEAGTLRAFIARTDVTTDLSFLAVGRTVRATPDGPERTVSDPRLVGGSSGGNLENLPFNRAVAPLMRRLNWREVSTGTR